MFELSPLVEAQIRSIIIAVIGSMAYAYSGYIKRESATEPWSNEKFFNTMAIALLVGVVAGWFDIPLEAATDYLIQTGAMTFFVVLLDNLWKFISRRYLQKAA